MPIENLEEEVEMLREKVEKIEEQGHSRIRFFVQYLLSPLLVAGVAASLNMHYQGQLEAQRNEISQYELVNKMLPQLVHNSTQVADATRVVLEHVIIDETLRMELNRVFKESVLAQAKSSLAAARPGQRQQILEQTTQIVPELEPQLNQYDKALQLESSAFDALVKDDVVRAISDFKEVEKVYPQFHNASEIATLLEQKQADWDDATTRKETYQQLIDEYSWKAPKPQLKALRQKAN